MREDLICRRERILDEDQDAQFREAQHNLAEPDERKKQPAVRALGANEKPPRFGATIGELCKGVKIQ